VTSLPMTQSGLDRISEFRKDETFIAEQWAKPAKFVVVGGGRLELANADSESGTIAKWMSTAPDPQLPDQDWVFLGLDSRGEAYFAVSGEVAGPNTVGLRDLAVVSAPDADEEMARLATAVGVLNWHEKHQFCPRCGTRTLPTVAGWERKCPADDSHHFPRVDPAVIMLVEDESGRALLARQARWPVGWFSTLAGFVEPGESFEAAVTREVAEEAGVKVVAHTYFGTQPWPFPSSVMIGFRATAVDSPTPTPDGIELLEARWFDREDLLAQCEAGNIKLPSRLSLSRSLIEDWYGGRLPGGWGDR
jgi:NAD+ diphosphatase